MRIAVVEFPGSHSARDAIDAYGRVLGQEAYSVWHQEESLQKPDIVVLPGGASFADYLRPGALARCSPIAGPIRKFAKDGGPILGIGNGFQVLCELGVLPGLLLLNPSSKYVNEETFVNVESTECVFASKLEKEAMLKLPISCKYGRYYCDTRELKTLEETGRVVFRYCDAFGDTDFNRPYLDSAHAIAGISNRHGNVLGTMLHPERVVEELMGGTEGVSVLSGVLS